MKEPSCSDLFRASTGFVSLFLARYRALLVAGRAKPGHDAQRFPHNRRSVDKSIHSTAPTHTRCWPPVTKISVPVT